MMTAPKAGPFRSRRGANQCRRGARRGTHAQGTQALIGLTLALSTSLSCFVAPNGDVVGPTPPAGFSVRITPAAAEISDCTATTLDADVPGTGGTPPFLFRWDINDAPDEDFTLTDVQSATLSTGTLIAPGRYVFRVVATDSTGSTAEAFESIVVTATVTPSISADAPQFIIVGEATALEATLDGDDTEGIELAWEVITGTATLDDTSSLTPNLIATIGEAIEVIVRASRPCADGVPAEVSETLTIMSLFDQNERVLVETSLGDFTIELNTELAPLHAINMLGYVDEGFYDGLVFHRVVCTADPDGGDCDPFILQTGSFFRNDEDELVAKDPTRDPVTSEADNGLTNAEIYSVALALPGDPNGGTSQFFINLSDNGFLDDQRFTVFGKVVDGFDVIDTITAVETTDNPFGPGGEVSLPVEDVVVERITRVTP